MTPEQMGFELIWRGRERLTEEEIAADMNGGDPFGPERAHYALEAEPRFRLVFNVQPEPAYKGGWWQFSDWTRRGDGPGSKATAQAAVIAYADRLETLADMSERDCAKAQAAIERRLSGGQSLGREALFSLGVFALDCGALILYGPEGAREIVQRMRADAKILRECASGEKVTQPAFFC